MSDPGAAGGPAPNPPASPLDEFLAEALRWLQDRQQMTTADVSNTMSEHLSWPVGFAEVVTQALRINHLLHSSAWEPTKLSVSDHGVAWLDAYESAR